MTIKKFNKITDNLPSSRLTEEQIRLGIATDFISSFLNQKPMYESESGVYLINCEFDGDLVFVIEWFPRINTNEYKHNLLIIFEQIRQKTEKGNSKFYVDIIKLFYNFLIDKLNIEIPKFEDFYDRPEVAKKYFFSEQKTEIKGKFATESKEKISPNLDSLMIHEEIKAYAEKTFASHSRIKTSTKQISETREELFSVLTIEKMKAFEDLFKTINIYFILTQKQLTLDQIRLAKSFLGRKNSNKSVNENKSDFDEFSEFINLENTQTVDSHRKLFNDWQAVRTAIRRLPMEFSDDFINALITRAVSCELFSFSESERHNACNIFSKQIFR